MVRMFKLILIGGLLTVAWNGSADAANTQPEHCDFRLYAPGDSDESTSLVLERSDLQEMRWGTEGDVTYWYIDVADHAKAKWEEAVTDSVGLSMSLYCGEELVASPTIRAPLGHEFKVAGLENEAGHWK